jgi:hypothetical protein
MKNGLTIALAISLVLGAAAVWGSCAVPHRVDDGALTHPIPPPSPPGESAASAG